MPEAFTKNEYPISARRSTTGSPAPTPVPAWLDVGLDLLLLGVVVALSRLDVSDWIFVAALAAGWVLGRRVRAAVAARRDQREPPT